MSSWAVNYRDELQELDYGSMHLNESPSLYYLPNRPSRASIQSLAMNWLERSYETNHISSADYHRRLQEIRRSIRLGMDSGATCTDNIIRSLKQLIETGWLSSRWKLINVDCDHFAFEQWERGFACCYRNAQCILSSLFRLPDFKKRLFGSFSAMPSVWKLQALLESAWSLGFDPFGASEISSLITSNMTNVSDSNLNYPFESMFDPSIVPNQNLIGLVDSTAWLGGTDLSCLLGSIGVRSSIIECRAPSGPLGTHPYLMAHINSYISSGISSSNSENFTLPMLLQHDGHSRIVIGIQVDDNDNPTALIVLDPGMPLEAIRQLVKAADYSVTNPTLDLSHAFGSYNWTDVLHTMRLDANDLVQPQYQLIQINGLIETDSDLQDSMIPENITIMIS